MGERGENQREIVEVKDRRIARAYWLDVEYEPPQFVIELDDDSKLWFTGTTAEGVSVERLTVVRKGL